MKRPNDGQGPVRTATGFHPVWMEGPAVCLIDQRELPHRRTVLKLDRYEQCIEAIREMAVRGAGTIGVTGAFAAALAARSAPEAGFREQVEAACSRIASARPTAKNLSYAVERVLEKIRAASGIEAARSAAAVEAAAVLEDDARMSEAIGKAGLPLLPESKAVLTHCNAGWLAYDGWGTALAPVYLAHAEGRPVFVYATETRPRSQGAKLTVWELSQAGVPHALLADTAAGYTMRSGEIGMVVVGADRIAANGDTANKIGTYALAVLAQAHRIPFYVAAPSPTFDAACPSGDRIPIEQRDEREVLEFAPPGVRARNPAFDVTPAALVTGFITECGLVAPRAAAIADFLEKAEAHAV